MRRTILTLGFLMALFALALVVPTSHKVTAAFDKHDQSPGGPHTPTPLCHRTGSAKNPFVLIVVDDDSNVIGHFKHGDKPAGDPTQEGGPCGQG